MRAETLSVYLCPFYVLTPISRSGNLRSQRQHRPYIHPREGAQTEQSFDLGPVFAQCRGARGIAGEVVGYAPDLIGEQREHGGGHRIPRQ